MIARDEGTRRAAHLFAFAMIRYVPHSQHTHARAYIPVCTSKQKKMTPEQKILLIHIVGTVVLIAGYAALEYARMNYVDGSDDSSSSVSRFGHHLPSSHGLHPLCTRTKATRMRAMGALEAPSYRANVPTKVSHQQSTTVDANRVVFLSHQTKKGSQRW